MGKIKETLKDWLVEHERLYWYIVVGFAVLAFGFITMLGLAKLEKADAATPENYNKIMENRDESKQYYALLELVDNMHHELYLFESDSDSVINLYYERENNTDVLKVQTGKGGYKLLKCSNGKYTANVTSTISFNFGQATLTYIEGNMTWASGIPMFGENWSIVDERPAPVVYSSSAPYVKFDSLDIVAPLATTPYDLKVFKDVPAEYADYNNWYWQYNGHIENPMGIVPDEYSLNMVLTCQFPTYEYIFTFWDDCIDERTLLKKTPVSVREWMANDLEAETYKLEQTFTLDVADDGTFSLKIPYSVVHALLVYEYHELLSLYGSCTNDKVDFCDVMMSYLYVSDITMCLEISVENQIYYGRTIFNHFSKGVTNKAVVSEVLIDVATATPEELDAAISAALQKGFQDALKETQDQINDMQNDLDSIFEVDGALSGNLEGSDLWIGFSNLAEGLASLAPSISALSVLTGAVFGFLPMTITGIMSFTLLAICIIAIIKAIRG